MNFDLKRPCADCPFRTDVPGYLSKARAAEIAHSLIEGQQTFSCHKLNDFSEDGEAIEGHKSQHCAGALIFLEAQGRPNQMMRIAERLGFYDRTRLDMDSPVHKTRSAFVRHHGSRRRRRAATSRQEPAHVV